MEQEQKQKSLSVKLSDSLNVTDVVHQYGKHSTDEESVSGDSPSDVVLRKTSSTASQGYWKDAEDPNGNSQDQLQQKGSEDRLSTCLAIMRNITVEPAVFLHMLVTSVEMTIQQNLILHKVCFNDMGLNDTECMSNTNSSVESVAQVYATRATMYITLTSTLPGILFSFFLGAYSDRHGRKLHIVVPVLGMILSSVLFSVLAHYDNVPALYLCLAALPHAVSGGLIAFNSACLSYVADRSSAESRTQRVALVEACLLLGTPVGTLLAGFLSQYGYVLTYVIGAVLETFALVYVLVVIRNVSFVNRRTQDVEASTSGFGKKFRDLFDFDSIRLTLETTFRRREEGTRIIIFLLLITTFTSLIAIMGSTTIRYMFTRLMFSWDLVTYSYFSALEIAAVVCGMLVTVVVFVRMLKISDTVLGIFGSVAAIVHSLAFALSTNATLFYYSIIPAAFSMISLLAVRSMISKLVLSDEQGKVFSVAASLDAIVPLVTSITFTHLYDATLTYFPQACFYLSAIILVIPLVLLIIVHTHFKVRPNLLVTRGYQPIE